MRLMLSVARDTTTFRGKISSDKWIDHVRTAFAVDPRIALSMPLRFPTNATMQSEITQLVQVWFFFPMDATFSDIIIATSFCLFFTCKRSLSWYKYSSFLSYLFRYYNWY
jgi:hypothetical protein